MKHADQLIERILFLEGVPNMQRLNPRAGRRDRARAVRRSTSPLEYEAIERLNDGIAACVAAGDNGTRHLLEEILVSEEEHADWLETQLGLIESLGLPSYLAEQLQASGASGAGEALDHRRHLEDGLVAHHVIAERPPVASLMAAARRSRRPCPPSPSVNRAWWPTPPPGCRSPERSARRTRWRRR